MKSDVTLSFKPSFELHELRRKNKNHFGRWLIEEIPCANKEKYRAAIISADKIVGEVHFRNFERELSPRECAISYWIDKDHLNQGFATKGVKIAADYAIENLDVDIVVAYVHELNMASISTVKRVGFTLQGLRRIPMYEGGTVDTHLRYVYGIL